MIGLKLLILATLFELNSPITEAGNIIITITNIQTNEGQIMLNVFNDPDGFPRKPENAFTSLVINVNNNSAIAEFNLPPGTYAISVAHDINKNNKIDTNFIGIPKEPLGVSNYSEKGRPDFDKAKFTLLAGETIELEIPVFTIF